MSVMQSNKNLVFFLYVFEKVSISETHRILGGLPSMAVCVQPSVFHTHTQRWSVCLLLLQGYMCVSAVLINLLKEQVFSST